MKLPFVALFAVISSVAVQGGTYEFVLESDEVFEKCPEYPESIGFYDAFDLANMTFVYNEGSIRVIGNSTCIWEGVKPTDRIAAHGDAYKFQRGSWQPTLLTVSKHDYCKTLFDKNSLSYQAWSTHVFEEDRKCFNIYGHTYHHHPYDVNTVLEFPGNMEGRYKVVGRITAYDKNNVKRKNPICFQILGEYVKVKRNTPDTSSCVVDWNQTVRM